MAQNPNPSLLDPGQIVKRAFNSDNDALRVDATVSASPGAIIIDDADDSIKIGNGSGVFAQVTGANALKVDASGTNLSTSVLNALLNVAFDTFQITASGTYGPTTILYKAGGLSGTTVMTINLVYDSNGSIQSGVRT